MGVTWVDSGIWEFGPNMQAWDLMDSGNDIITTISLGGPGDTSWSPNAVVEPIIRRAIRRATTGAGGSSSVTPADTEGPEPSATESIERGLGELDGAVSGLL